MNNEGLRQHCPRCNSPRTVLNGLAKGQQTYLCNDCTKRWRERRAVGGHSYPPDQIGACIQEYYTTLSYRYTAKVMKEQLGLKGTGISPQTILNWVHRYTHAAVKLTRGCEVSGGGKWWLFSLPLPLHSRMWWMVLDDTTGYILASHVDAFMTEHGARPVLLQALASAVRPCAEIVYWVVWSGAKGPYHYVPEEAVLKVLRETLPHRRVMKDIGNFPPSSSAPVVAENISRCLGNRRLLDRIKDHDNLRLSIAGWVITENLFTKHWGLGGRTRGETAGVKVPVANWADVVRLEAQAYLPAADT